MILDETSARPLAHTRPDACIVAAVARLTAEFADDVRAPVIRQVVDGSRRDLDGCPVGALPELVERLARQRLLQYLTSVRTEV